MYLGLCRAVSTCSVRYRDDEAPLLEVLDQGDGVLLKVGQTPVDGFGVVVGATLLLGPPLQALLQAVGGARQKHHHVGSADLAAELLKCLSCALIHIAAKIADSLLLPEADLSDTEVTVCMATARMHEIPASGIHPFMHPVTR